MDTPNLAYIVANRFYQAVGVKREPGGYIGISEFLLPNIERILSKEKPKAIKLARKEIAHIAPVQGFMIASESQIEIVYSSELNREWARFFIAKELGVLLLDNALQLQSKKFDFTAHTSELMNPTPGAPIENYQPQVFLALELLMPWELHDEIDSFASDDAGVALLASKFVVPEDVARMRLSSEYRSFASRQNELALASVQKSGSNAVWQ